MMATPGGMIPPNQLQQQMDQNKNSPIGTPGNINANIQKSDKTTANAPKRRRKTKEPKQAPPAKQQPVKQQTPSNIPPQQMPLQQQQQQQQLPIQNIPMPVQIPVPPPQQQQQLPQEPQLPPPPREPTAEELRKLIPPPEVIKDLNYWSNSIRNNTKRSQKKSVPISTDILTYEQIISKDINYFKLLDKESNSDSKFDFELNNRLMNDVKYYSVLRDSRLKMIQLNEVGKPVESIWGEGYQGYELMNNILI
ncbi:unnamed protein product [[Candida] boidinii]|nr:unnamed protein product [[Candida] boidinii]